MIIISDNRVLGVQNHTTIITGSSLSNGVVADAVVSEEAGELVAADEGEGLAVGELAGAGAGFGGGDEDSAGGAFVEHGAVQGRGRRPGGWRAGSA
jgi:hypothetical protein